MKGNLPCQRVYLEFRLKITVLRRTSIKSVLFKAERREKNPAKTGLAIVLPSQ